MKGDYARACVNCNHIMNIFYKKTRKLPENHYLCQVVWNLGRYSRKRNWDEHELSEHWSLTHNEFELLQNRRDRSRIGFAALLKFFQAEGRFPTESSEVPTLAVDYLASQLAVSPEVFAEYDLGGRSCERDRAQIRALHGFRRVSVSDGK